MIPRKLYPVIDLVEENRMLPVPVAEEVVPAVVEFATDACEAVSEVVSEWWDDWW